MKTQKNIWLLFALIAIQKYGVWNGWDPITVAFPGYSEIPQT